MRKKKAVGSAMVVAALLTSSAFPAAHAIEVDTTPPELVSYKVTPSVIDARKGGTVKAIVHAKDNTCLADVDPALTLRNASGNSYGGFIFPTRVSGDCRDGIYETSISIPATELGRQPFGQWELSLWPLTDTLGNSSAGWTEIPLTYAASPDAAKNIQVTVATPATLSASWTAPDANGSPITKYVVQVKDSEEATVAMHTVASASLKNLSVDLTAGRTYTLEVTAYNQIGGTEAAWTTFVPQVAQVTASTPVFTDKSGTASDTLTIPTKAGVQYYVNGAARAAGTYKSAGTVTVTAKANAGYSLTGTTSWKTTFSRNIEVTPAAATFADKSGTASDTVTIPAKTGVQYYVNGTAKAAGTYKASGTITVTAKAKTGYALTGTTSWKRAFSKLIIVVPSAAVFSDKPGTAYDRYTIPAKTGVQYYVNGAAKGAGTYKGAGAVTVTAKAKTGYALSGLSTWKRTFGR